MQQRRIKLLSGMLILIGLSVPHLGYAQTPSLTVIADDLGDLNAGDQGTAAVSATINNPPQPSKEGSMVTTYTWSIQNVTGGQVTVDQVNAPTNTVHAEFDDPGDYYYEVSCTVNCHDTNSGQDYGPYTDYDWVGDPDDAGAGPSAVSPKLLSKSSGAKTKRPTHVVLHFHVTNMGRIYHNALNADTFWIFQDKYMLGVVLKSGLPFTKGYLSESFPIAKFSVNPSYKTYFPAPPVAASGIAHSAGTIIDNNNIPLVYKAKDGSTHFCSFEQDFSNTSPNANSDNSHFLSYDAPGSTRTVN